MQILVIISLIAFSLGSVMRAESIDDVSFYLVENSEDFATMLIYENGLKDSSFLEIFEKEGTLHNIELLSVDISEPQLEEVYELIEEKPLPYVMVLDKGKKVIEEKLGKATKANLLDYISENRSEFLQPKIVKETDTSFMYYKHGPQFEEVRVLANDADEHSSRRVQDAEVTAEAHADQGVAPSTLTPPTAPVAPVAPAVTP